MSLIDDIRRDRGAGTPGPWQLDGIAITYLLPPYGSPVDVCLMGEPAQSPGDILAMMQKWEMNARRIARVPDMEAALIAAQVLVDALDANAPIDQIDTALAAYRKATGASQ
jgi:hypothetical protein